MKKLILSTFLFISLSAFSQSKTSQDAKGNFIAVSAKMDKAKDSATGKTFTDAGGNVWPVFINSKGRYYALRTSKAGNEYKQYLN